MASLLDIVPLNLNVTIRGNVYPVSGINVEGIAYLMRRFPLIANVMNNPALRSTLSAATFLAMAPDIIAAIIATGLGKHNDPDIDKIEASLQNLAFGEQLTCIEKIMEVTLPQGIRPFVESLNKLGEIAGSARGMVEGTTSDEQSNNSSTKATTA